MILLQIPKLQFSTDNLIPVYIAWATMGGSAIAVLLASRYFAFTKEVTGSLMLVSVLTNSIFVGIPVTTAYYGTESLPFILLYDQLGTSIWLAVYGSIVISYYSSKGNFSFISIIKKVMRFPPLLAFISAILLSSYTYPDLISTLLELIALSVVPLALISVGLQLQFRLNPSEIKPFAVSLFIKLIIAPLIALVICLIFGWDQLLVGKVSIMESGMAAMITAGILASINGLAPRLSNAIVAYGIAFSIVTSWGLFILIEYL